MPRTNNKWRPRGSALGYYFACTFRAAFDRALHEGALELPWEIQQAIEAKKASGPHADLGTVIHFHTQVKLGATFPGPTEAFAPDARQYANAAELFGGSHDALMRQVEQASDLTVQAIKTACGERVWDAEPTVKRPWITGHIDLVTRERDILLDIKTTSKPPHFATIPPTHLVQTLAYVEGLEEQEKHDKVRKVLVVYVDASAASWSCVCEYDPVCEGMLEYRAMIRDKAKMLMRADYMKRASPNVGDACNNYCPYVSLCRDRYSVAKGDVKRQNLAPKIKTVNPLAAALGPV